MQVHSAGHSYGHREAIVAGPRDQHFHPDFDAKMPRRAGRWEEIAFAFPHSGNRKSIALNDIVSSFSRRRRWDFVYHLNRTFDLDIIGDCDESVMSMDMVLML